MIKKVIKCENCEKMIDISKLVSSKWLVIQAFGAKTIQIKNIVFNDNELHFCSKECLLTKLGENNG